MTELVHKNLSKAQEKQKTWYDKKARVREFEPGDPVLVLLPTSSSKLLAQWQGPYQVVKRVGKVNYLYDHRKRKRVFHINMLRAFQVRRVAESNESVVDESDDDVLCWKDGDPGDQPTISNRLSTDQLEQLQHLLTEFSEVLKNQPGQTQLAEHKIDTGSARPVRLPPYRLPQAYRSEVHQELQEMQIIEPSTSEWAAPIVLVKKKDGSLRLC